MKPSKIAAFTSPTNGPMGQGTEKALQFWSGRASENSAKGARARAGEMALHSTAAPPRTAHKIE